MIQHSLSLFAPLLLSRQELSLVSGNSFLSFFLSFFSLFEDEIHCSPFSDCSAFLLFSGNFSGQSFRFEITILVCRSAPIYAAALLVSKLHLGRHIFSALMLPARRIVPSIKRRYVSGARQSVSRLMRQPKAVHLLPGPSVGLRIVLS